MRCLKHSQWKRRETGVPAVRPCTPRPLSHCPEITCECNPGTLTTPFAQALRKAGVNRLSMGAQARQTRLLRLLGRIHDWEEVIASVEIARKAGFDNINLDLMFGLPSQTVADCGKRWRPRLRSPPRISPVTV